MLERCNAFRFRCIHDSNKAASCRQGLESSENSIVDGINFRNCNWLGKILKEKHQIFLWLADDVLCLLRANNPCLVDGTYRIALHLFYQALFIMAFDRAMSCFVSC
ncbi:hypothetical protein MXB_3588, partial [Myxobolus squamalis]